MKRLITLTALTLCLSAQAQMVVKSAEFFIKDRPDLVAAQEAFSKRDQDAMVAYLTPAAQAGEPVAIHGMFYAYFYLSPVNMKKAEYWGRKAAAAGSLEIINDMAMWYYNGKLKPKNLVVAYALSFLAGTSEDKSEARSNARFTSAFLSKAQLARGDQLAQDLQKPNNFVKALDAYLKKHPIENPDPDLDNMR